MISSFQSIEWKGQCASTSKNIQNTDARLLSDDQLQLIENYRLHCNYLERELENNKKSKEAELLETNTAKNTTMSKDMTQKRNLSDVFQCSANPPGHINKNVKSTEVLHHPPFNNDDKVIDLSKLKK